MNSQAKQIPPLEFQSFAVHLQISIWRSNGKYIAYIIPFGNSCYQIDIDLTPSDVSLINIQFQNAINNLILEPENSDAVIKLIELSKSTYRRIFKETQDREFLQAALNLVPTCGVIQITSDEFIIPWDFLYDQEILSEESSRSRFSRFWGMRYIISRIRVVRSRPGDFVPPVIHNNCPKVGFFANEKLPAVMKRELPFFYQLQEDQKINLHVLRTLDPRNRISEIKTFIEIWKADFTFAHIACHAISDQMPDESRIILSNDFNIRVQDMEVYDLRISNYPLVIINGCNTGSVDPLYTSNLAGIFIEKGARGVIATEALIPDDIAADFTEILYGYLLSGLPLGESLMKSRKDLFCQYNYPVGLLYALYASPNFQIISH